MVLICQDDYLMQIRVLGSFFTVGFFCWWILGFGVFLMLVATRQSSGSCSTWQIHNAINRNDWFLDPL